MHIETDIRLTQKCLELVDSYGFGLAILTKSDLILRDLKLLESINRKAKCVVQITLTTFDEKLCRNLEPNVCTTARRFEVLKTMRDSGIPTVVWLDPILPFINDTEENLMGILSYCKEAKVYGIICFGIGLTLRDGNREYYYAKLEEHFPGLRERYHNKYGYSYEIKSDNDKRLMGIFYKECTDSGIVCNNDEIFRYMHTFEDKQQTEQISMF